MSTDDVFHLTPRDVRAQEFHRTLRGYDRVEVEEFKGRVAEELDRLLRERARLEERLQSGQDQLRAFRDRERAMNDALLAAQQIRSAAQEQADKDVEHLMRQAKADALRLVNQARDEERQIRERSEALQRQFASYVANFRALLERQLGEVEGLHTHAQLSHQVQTELLLKRQA